MAEIILLSAQQMLPDRASPSFVDSAVNGQLYDDSGYKIIYGVGTHAQCFNSPAIATTNTGPMLSGVGAAQYAVENLGAKKIYAIGGNIPNFGDYTIAGMEAYAEAARVAFEGGIAHIPDTIPG